VLKSPFTNCIAILVLATIAWGQSSIDEKIKQEQKWLSNENLPPSVKGIVEQRIAKLQQAKIIESQIEATQQYRDAHPDLSQGDKAAINATLSQLKTKLDGLLSQAPSQPAQVPQGVSQGGDQNKLQPSTALEGAANNAKSGADVKAGAASSSQNQNKDQNGNITGCLSGSTDNYALTDLVNGKQYKLRYKPMDDNALALLKAALKDATRHDVQVVGTKDEPGGTIEVAQVGQDNGPCTLLESSSLIAATSTSTMKTLAKAGATTIVRRRNGEPTDVFNEAAQTLALYTVLGAIDPTDFSKVSGDPLGLLQRQVNVKTETARTDKQLTAPANNSGSTSPVVRPGIQTLLGIGLASGAVQQQNSGTGLTLSTSPYSIAAALNGGDTDQNYKNYAVYQRLGASATFNVQGQTNPDPTQVSRRQLENWSARLRLTPDRSTRSQGFQDELGKTTIPADLGREGVTKDQLLIALGENQKVRDAVTAFAEDPKWLTKLLADNKDSADDKLESTLEQELIAHVQTDFIPQVAGQPIPKTDQFSILIANLGAAQQKHQAAAKTFEDLATEYSQKFEATLAYTNQYQLSQSPYSTIMFLADKHAGTGLTFTANAGVSLYQNPKLSLNQTTFRDFSTAFSAQQRLFRSPFLVNSLNESPVTASLAGSYQYLNEYAGVKGKKADVGTVTLKVEFPVAGGVSLPLSVTYATSPQDQALKSSSYTHGDFGLTFDLDKLYTILHAPQ